MRPPTAKTHDEPVLGDTRIVGIANGLASWEYFDGKRWRKPQISTPEAAVIAAARALISGGLPVFTIEPTPKNRTIFDNLVTNWNEVASAVNALDTLTD